MGKNARFATDCYGVLVFGFGGKIEIKIYRREQNRCVFIFINSLWEFIFFIIKKLKYLTLLIAVTKSIY